MDACPLFVTSSVALKPEDQGTFLQDFLGVSGYLCSMDGFYSSTTLLRTRNAQNHNEAQRLALGDLVGELAVETKNAPRRDCVPPSTPARIVVRFSF